MDNIKIAAAYLRVSTDDQTEYSPDAQRRELHDYAKKNNLLLDERYIYADEGISGRRAEKRPAFMKMIADAKSPEHPFDLILVHKFDRFARSREDSVVYKAMLRRVGVDVVSIKEPISDSTYAGLIESIYESVAEAYSLNLAQEVRKGMTEKALRGEPQTAPPFGYRLQKENSPRVGQGRRHSNSRFIPDEEEAPIVQWLFEQYAAGDTFFSLAKQLNARGITTHRGSRMENRTVEYILRNPVYIGMLRWNPKRRARRNYADPDTMTVQGNHQPIIDKKLWDTVQSRISEQKARWRYHARPSSDRKHWLCGIVRCAACNSTLILCFEKWLKCSNYVRGSCRFSQHIDVANIETAFLARLQHDTLSVSAKPVRLIRTASAAESALVSLRSELARAQKKRERLTDAYLNSAIELDEFNRLRPVLDSEIANAASAIAAAEQEQPPVDTSAALRNQIKITLATLTSDAATVAEKYEAANAIVEHCTWNKSTQTLSITYRISI